MAKLNKRERERIAEMLVRYADTCDRLEQKADKCEKSGETTKADVYQRKIREWSNRLGTVIDVLLVLGYDVLYTGDEGDNHYTIKER